MIGGKTKERKKITTLESPSKTWERVLKSQASQPEREWN
jgi:hypothetical protein